MPPPRVAVIAVHGVADQQPGDTARAVVELLVSSAPEGTRYTSSSSADLALRVAPLPPQAESVPEIELDSRATPSSEDRSVRKSFAQSLRSDFHRHDWASETAARPAVEPGAAAAQAELGVPPVDKDRGIALTNYLLAKHVRNGATPEAYDTACTPLQRHAVDSAEVTAEVDVYEMYWADLSRLSGSMPRIVSELFTFVFRLSKLGRGTVDEMSGQLGRARDPRAPLARTYKTAWSVLATLQIALDWLFVNGLALLFAQLALLAVLLVFLGFTSGIAPEIAQDEAARAAARAHQNWLHMGIAGVLVVLAVLRLLYRRGDGKWLQVAGPVGVIVLAVAALVFGIVAGPGLLQWLTAITFLLLITLANQAMLRIADDRFPLVHAAGSWMWGASALLMVSSAVHEMPALDSEQWREVWVHAALFTTETVLLAIKWWWIVAGPLLLVWFAAGQVARFESGYASRASVATGRLGITVSVGMFLVVTMTIWALANNVLSQSVDGVAYRPCVFAYAPVAGDPLPAPSAGANACIWTSRNAVSAAAHAPMPTASTVLYDRYANSTSAFSVLATLLMLLAAYLLMMFTPSVLAELKLIVDARRDAHRQELDRRTKRADPAAAAPRAAAAAKGADAVPDRRVPPAVRAQRARELGRWLTAGYRRLDLAVGTVTALGIVLSAGITVVFLSTVFAHARVDAWLADTHLTRLMDWIGGLQTRASGATQTIFAPLQALVFSAAGIGAALSVMGGQLSRRIPSLRGPLDVAMDVDNHFREFPRTDIPRAHIFSRYAALLEHVRGNGYDRIVVVAHSQGTVISAELLRFLSSRDQAAPRPGDMPLLQGAALPPINLLTLGCPLRQLYGARFPGLYAWVLAKNGDLFGPRAADIGVRRWMNAFCSGDYVGRWLWSHAGADATLAHPTANSVEGDPFGRADAYTGFDPMPPLDAVLDAAHEAEVCLGLGAHTHYFERDQTTVAWMIDYLVRAPAHDPAVPAAATAAGPVPTVDAAAGQPARAVAVEASVVSDGAPAPAAAPDATAPPAPPASAP